MPHSHAPALRRNGSGVDMSRAVRKAAGVEGITALFRREKTNYTIPPERSQHKLVAGAEEAGVGRPQAEPGQRQERRRRVPSPLGSGGHGSLPPNIHVSVTIPACQPPAIRNRLTHPQTDAADQTRPPPLSSAVPPGLSVPMRGASERARAPLLRHLET